jgi:dTDP-4-dehydrorhamnose 3,5-epimerase-like enzyme
MKLQNYEKPKVIQDVRIVDLTQYFDDGGSFCEVTRLWGDVGREQSRLLSGDGSGLAFEDLQINYSKVLKGVVKAFHVHKIQTDAWLVLDRAIVCLHDTRDDSFTTGVTMRLAAGVKPQLIVIPPGVVHGISACYGDVNMIYMVDRHFNPQDEFRLPWDFLGKDIWEPQNG